MYKDTRLLGAEKWYYISSERANMRIPEEIKKVVCFLCVREANGNYQSYGTGFFVGVHLEDWDFLYFVTAKHLLDDAKDNGYEKIYLRLNKKNGGIDYVELNTDAWFHFEEEPIDLTLIGVAILPSDFDYSAIPIENLASNETIQEHNIGLGDDLFMVGLFTKRKGRSQNIPIIRTGIISAMPDEPFLDEFGDEYNAYLAEVRSIGGLSGSPVFVYIDKNRTINPNLPEGIDWKHSLIGLIRGHWELDDEQKDSSFIMDAPPRLNDGEKLNTGIAKVTPSQFILRKLNDPSLQKARVEWVRMKEKDNEDVLDSSLQKAENEFSSKDFQNALKLASRKISEPVSEKKET